MTGALNADKWWTHKPPLMLAVGYSQLAATSSPPALGFVLVRTGLFILATIGIAGLGHVLNDYFDREQDTSAGASNVVSRYPIGRLRMLVAGLLVAAIIPWIWLPTGGYIVPLLAAELLLFCAYSIPPLRLKGRSLGALADALYGYTIPVLVCFLVFAQMSGSRRPIWMVALLAGWTLALGLRWILLHQLETFDRDARANDATFAVRRGWMGTVRLLAAQVLPVEALLFASVLLAIGAHAVFAPLGFVLYAALIALRWRSQRFALVETPVERMTMRVALVGVRIMSRFQTTLFALLVLISLCIGHPAFVVLLILHVCVFQNGPREALGSLSSVSRAWKVGHGLA